jgi:hypothetical protein
MRRDFEIFERFPDGSTLWKCCVRGRFEAKRKMQELAEVSENEFLMIDIQADESLPMPAPNAASASTAARPGSRLLAKSAHG